MAERLCRYIEVDRSKIDRDARTIPLSFSSEYPALQRADGNLSADLKRAAGLSENEVYVEILDHEPSNVDLSLLNNGGAFLDEHDDKAQLGVVERAEVSEKLGRAVVKLGTDDLAVTRFAQMADGIRKHISAGYKYTRFLGDTTLPNGRKAKRFAWRALELSSVAIPADPTIGVARKYQDLPESEAGSGAGRADSGAGVANGAGANGGQGAGANNGSANAGGVDEVRITEAERSEFENFRRQKRNMKTAEEIAAEKAAEAAINERLERSLGAERARVGEISTVADALIKDHGKKNRGELAGKIRTMANEAISKKDEKGNFESAQDFKVRCMTEVLGAKPAEPIRIEDCTDDPSEYSLLRGIQSCLRRKSNVPDGREGEVHQEVVRRSEQFGGLGYEAEGFQVPHNAGLRMGRAARGRMTRDMQATVFAQGGAFVPTNLVVPIIELLRNRLVLNRVGMRTMAGLQGNIVIPRQEAAVTAFSVSEIGALTDSQQILGQIALKPNRVGSTQKYSKQFVMQSSPDAEAFIRDDHMKVIALAWDRLGLNGQGANSEPLGVMNTPGIASIVFGATPTYIKLISMRTLLRAANVIDELSLLSTPGTEGSLSGVAEALTGATTVGGAQNAIWKPGPDQSEGRVIGCPAMATNQVPNNQVILGAFEHLIHALWGGLDVIVDQLTLATNAETKLTINTWGDFAVRHPQAFCVSADAGNQ